MGMQHPGGEVEVVGSRCNPVSLKLLAEGVTGGGNSRDQLRKYAL